MEDKNIYTKLQDVQERLKVHKERVAQVSTKKTGGQYKYYYRNAEDILEAVKPLLKENELVLTLSDDIVLIGERYYVKATATLIDVESDKTLSVTAYAREDATQNGNKNDEEGTSTKMRGGQLTGATSSYARKYALNGLFAIDDTKDLDDLTKQEEDEEDVPQQKTYTKPTPKEPPQVEAKTEEPKKAEEEKRDFNEVLFDMFKKGNFINIEPKEVKDLIKKKDWFDREIAVNDMTQPQFRRLIVLLGKENEMREEPF